MIPDPVLHRRNTPFGFNSPQQAPESTSLLNLDKLGEKNPGSSIQPNPVFLLGRQPHFLHYIPRRSWGRRPGSRQVCRRCPDRWVLRKAQKQVIPVQFVFEKVELFTELKNEFDYLLGAAGAAAAGAPVKLFIMFKSKKKSIVPFLQ